jgi:hypothetical protein
VNEQDISEDEPREVCRAKIKYHIRKYCQIVEEVKRCEWLSDDLKICLDAIKASHSGNLA